MRIGAYTQISQIYNTSNSKKTQGTQKTSGKDQVTISRTGVEFNLLQQALKSVPDVREELVTEVKRQIDEGSYKVSGEDFADKLLARYYEINMM